MRPSRRRLWLHPPLRFVPPPLLISRPDPPNPAGDLLRAEQARPGSDFGDLIKDHIKEGKIVPMEVTIKLLENAMRAAVSTATSRPSLFLVDGFPRQMDQAVKFDASVSWFVSCCEGS